MWLIQYSYIHTCACSNKFDIYFSNKACGPKIVAHPTDTSAGAPFSAVFTCSAIGYGNLSIEWKRSDSLGIPIKSFYRQVSSSTKIITSTLIIPNVTDVDSGSYYCVGWIDMQASKSKSALLYYSGELQNR